jgi:hypothetical protein
MIPLHGVWHSLQVPDTASYGSLTENEMTSLINYGKQKFFDDIDSNIELGTDT